MESIDTVMSKVLKGSGLTTRLLQHRALRIGRKLLVVICECGYSRCSSKWSACSPDKKFFVDAGTDLSEKRDC